MSDKTWAAFNTITITGRVGHIDLVDGEYGLFADITLFSELQDEAKAIAVHFRASRGQIFSLAKSGFLPKGRLMTVTGHLDDVSELYFDKKSGQMAPRQRKLIELSNPQVFAGGFGPLKKAESQDQPSVDAAPELPQKKERVPAPF